VTANITSQTSTDDLEQKLFTNKRVTAIDMEPQLRDWWTSLSNVRPSVCDAVHCR